MLDQRQDGFANRRPIFAAGVQLAIAKRPCPALAKAVVRIARQLAAGQLRQVMSPRLHRLALFYQDHVRARFAQPLRTWFPPDRCRQPPRAFFPSAKPGRKPLHAALQERPAAFAARTAQINSRTRRGSSAPSGKTSICMR